MMRLAILIPSLGLGGAERSLVKLVDVLACEGHEVTILCMGQAVAEIRSELHPAVALKVFNSKRSANPMLLWQVWRYLRSTRPDAVAGWSLYANFIGVIAAKLAGIGHVLVSERNYLPQMLGTAGNSPLRRWLVTRLIRWLYAKATVVTANSQLSLRFLRKYAPGARHYEVLPNLADVERFEQAARGPVPSGLPRGAGFPRLLAVGRLHHQKGFDVLIRAMAKLRERAAWPLYLAGAGPEGRALEALAKEQGLDEQVHFLGEIGNPFPMYDWADIVIAPSRFEGFPNVPLEAMCAGSAVIVTDCKSGPRELTENGTYAVLVPVDDVDKLAESILALGSDELRVKQLGDAAQMHVLREYSRQAVVPRYLSVFSLLQAP